MFKTVVVNLQEDGTNNWNAVNLKNDKYGDLFKHINKFGTFDFVGLDDVPEGNAYAVYLRANYDFYKDSKALYKWCKDGNARKAYFDMPARVKKDSAAGKVFWILEWHTESTADDRIDFAALLKGLHLTDPKKFVFFSAADTRWDYSKGLTDVATELGFSVYFSNILFNFCTIFNQREERTDLVTGYTDFVAQKTQDILDKKPTKYIGVCYNRQPRQHRLAILAHLRRKKLLDKTIYSLGGDAPRFGLENPYTKSKELEYLTEDYEYFVNHKGSITTGFGEDIDLDDNQAHSLCYEHALSSRLHIVTETVSNTYTFNTEKSYKPFMYLQPFIQFGNVKNVQALRNNGYMVFDEYIDHSYDDEPDDVKRMQLFLKEVDRLYSISDEDWGKMLYNMLEGLHHNMSLVSVPQEHHPAKYIIKDLHAHFS